MDKMKNNKGKTIQNRYGVDVLEWTLPVPVVEALLVDHSIDGSIEALLQPCPACKCGDVKKHNGTRCRVMDWEAGKPVFIPTFEFKPIEEWL